VLTVDVVSQLLIDGKLGGRVVAVSGYWMQGMPMSCPFVPREPILSTRCLTVGLADEYLHLGSYTPNSYSWSARQGLGLLIPVTVTETSQGRNGFLPSQLSADNPNPAQRVVVIGHAGDARLLRCEPDRREECGDVFVVDRFAWVNGVYEQLEIPYTDLQPALTLDGVLSAAQVEPAQALTAYPVQSSEVGSIDPRLSGAGGDLLWVVRAVSGEPGADGTSAAVNIVVDDSDGSLIRTVPLAVAGDQEPDGS
jgi:hypothetical protein